MCWSFEKLRVIKEYKSPRSLRSFTKVFIFLMPLLLSPYYVFTSRKTNSEWAAYVIAVLVSFLFGSLQAVQDKLDDPFDGIGEDDVHLGQVVLRKNDLAACQQDVVISDLLGQLVTTTLSTLLQDANDLFQVCQTTGNKQCKRILISA